MQTVGPIPVTEESAPNRIRWTRHQCDAIVDAGILHGRYELVDGEILTKMGQKPLHAAVIQLLTAWLAQGFGVQFVRIQLTIDVSESSPLYDEPEPDAAVTAQPATAYISRHPGPADLLLLVEVADSTVRFDLSKKAALYARAGIQDYWVLDLPGRVVYVHRQPAEEGFAEIVVYSANERIAPLARPEAAVMVSDLLPAV